MTYFQKKIVSERNNRGFTQEEFATKLGFDIEKYKLWEEGQIYPNIEEHERISDYLNMSAKDWIRQDKAFIENHIKDYSEKLKGFTYRSLVLVIINIVPILILLVPMFMGVLSSKTYGLISVTILGVGSAIYFILLLRMNRIRQEMQVDEYSKLLKYIED